MQTQVGDQKIDSMKKEKKEWARQSLVGQRHSPSYTASQCIYMCLCVFCLFGQMHRPIFGFLSVIKVSVDVEQIHGPCLISLCFSPHPSGPALHPFPPPWQHPKQPALITTHPSIRTFLRPGQVSSPGEIGQARSQRMDEDRVRYQRSLKGRAPVWGFGVEGMCQLLCEECCYSWNQHVQTKRHTHIHSQYLFPDTHNPKYKVCTP